MASWFYVRNNQQMGPVSLEQLQALLSSGQIQPQDRVWSEGMSDWVPANTVRELAAVSPATSLASPASTIPTAAEKDISYESQGGSYGIVATDLAIDLLRQTRPWVLFMSIMTFIGAGLMFLGGIAMIAMGLISGARAGSPAIIGIIYIPMAFLYIMPAIFLGRYASSIKQVLTYRQPAHLESALRAQKSFWKFVGIMTLVMISFYILAIIGAFIVGIAAVSSMHR